MSALRLNQGDPSEARIYYAPHYVAAELQFFAQAGLEVDFVWTASDGDRVTGGQVPAVLRGAADLTIGGPMVTMRMWQDGDEKLVSFCGVVGGNPWLLAARPPRAGFAWSALRGQTILDVANITTATLCFRWLLRQHDVEAHLLPGSGDAAADLAAVAAGTADFALHSLHGIAPHLADKSLEVVTGLAGPTAPVPWSAYIARPETLRDRRPEFVAFTAAIACALRWMHSHPDEDIADLIALHYPNLSQAALLEGIAFSRTVWPADPRIAPDAFNHFGRILTDIGWLDRPAPYDELVDPTLVDDALTEYSR